MQVLGTTNRKVPEGVREHAVSHKEVFVVKEFSLFVLLVDLMGKTWGPEAVWGSPELLLLHHQLSLLVTAGGSGHCGCRSEVAKFGMEVFPSFWQNTSTLRNYSAYK